MRGEKSVDFAVQETVMGSPPHARGKAAAINANTTAGRITPACAGKRSCGPGPRRCSADHPRMRGEKGALLVVVFP